MSKTITLRFAEAAHLLSEGFSPTVMINANKKSDFIFADSALLETERVAFAENNTLQRYLEGVSELQKLVRNVKKQRKDSTETTETNLPTAEAEVNTTAEDNAYA